MGDGNKNIRCMPFIVAPQFRYGLDLSDDVKKTPSKSRLPVLEHRKELEKTVIVKRLREEVIDARVLKTIRFHYFKQM